MTKHQNLPLFSHLRANDLATLHTETSSGDVPVRVLTITDGNTATFTPTADRPGFTKGQTYTVMHNLKHQHLTTRTKSQTTLLVF